MAGVNFLPIQAGTGDPSPTNVRPITPGLSITGIGDIYGGYLDVANGAVVEEWGSVVLDGINTAVTYASSRAVYTLDDGSLMGRTTNGWFSADTLAQNHMISNSFSIGDSSSSDTNAMAGFVNANLKLQARFVFKTTDEVSSGATANAWFANKYNNNEAVMFIYPLATPITHPLTTAQLTEAMQKLKVPSAPAQALHRRLANTPYPVSTTPASVTSFDTDMVGKLKSAKFAFSPVQSGSGDPSPTNVRPITGWTGAKVSRTGKNLISSARVEGAPVPETGTPVNRQFDFGTFVKGINQTNYYYPSIIQSVAVVDNTLTFVSTSDNYGIGYPCEIKPGMHYYCTATHNCHDAFVSFYSKSGEYLSNMRAFTTDGWTAPSNASFCVIVFMGTANTETTVSNLMLSLSSGATYLPYVGATLSVSWETEAGTIYGGYVDVCRGVVVAEYGIVDLGTLDWTYRESGTRFLSEDIVSTIKAPSTSQDTIGAMCSSYKYMSLDSLGMSTIALACAVSSNKIVYIKNTGYADPVELKTAVSGVQFVYELATPITYSITPTIIKSLKGANNLWSNANGDATITYWTH